MNPRKQELQSPVGSEEQLRLFVDGIKDYAMFMLDPEGRILTWNQGAERIKGYKLEEIRGRHFSIFYSPEDIERQEPQRELKIAALEGRFEADGWRLRKDGSRFWANVVLTALRDPSGQLRGFGKVTRDLTERKWAADATFEKLFRASPHPTSIATFQDGRFVEVNEAFCRLTGYSAQELIGRTSIEMQLWTRPQERIRLVSTLKSGKPMVAEEGGMRTKSGAERTVLLSASGIEIGGESCIFATFQDITESRRLEAAVRELSTPVLQAQDRLLIVPLIGTVDAARASQLRDQLLDAIRRRRAKAVVIDLTGVPKVDARIADGLLRTVEAARLLGASVILAGISHGMAQALIDISVGFGTITTTVDLQSGIEAANRLFGQEPTRGTLVRRMFDNIELGNMEKKALAWMPQMRILRLIPPAFAVLTLSAAEISPQAYLDHVRYLASPELKGRATGSPELEKAANYIASQFKSFGLKPPDGKNFEQAFPVTVDAHLGPGNHLRWISHDESVTEPQAQFQAFSFSSAGKILAPVVFAGYGITANEYHYDDYAGLDVKDKIVLILRHEPQEVDEKSVFAGKELTRHATFASKAANAKMHGARAVILINDAQQHPGESDELEKFSRAAGPNDAGILFVQVKVTLASLWLRSAGQDLRAIAGEIDKHLKPRSFAVPGLSAEVEVDVRRDSKTVHNVAAYLPGETKEYVVIGAHYDHLGLGDQNSLAPSQAGTVHPGADDNASGTAGVIELASWFSKQPKGKRGVMFLAFAGEELGLLGSGWYVNHPILPLADAVAMINMDMIGRIRQGKVYLSGTGTGTTFGQMIDELKPPAPIHVDLSEKAGYGASDHTSFTTKQVPVLFFFSGLHGDYHKPGDTPDKIDSEDAAKLLDYIAGLADHLANDPVRPQFVRISEPSQPAVSGGGSGYGPNFGSIPDFNEPPKGVRFADVRDGTPAAKAGLRAGDILIEFDGKEIGNLYDFTYALRAHKPGDLVLVKVLRGSQIIEAKVLLTERR